MMPDFWLPRPDGLNQFVRVTKTTKPKAAIIIAHGMAEHSERFLPIANVFSENNFIAYLPDHRGHGETALQATSAENKLLGHFADDDGWPKVTEDLCALVGHVKSVHSDIPLVFMGHSMGSFLAQEVLYKKANVIDAFILSGTGKTDNLVEVAIKLAKFERMFIGKRKTAKLLRAAAVKKFSEYIPNAHKTNAWLSRDKTVCDVFNADPLCGFDLSVQAAIDMMTGLQNLHRDDKLALVPKDLPVYIFGGTEDALSWGGEAARWLAERYKTIGIKSVSLHLYKGGRHEMLNELNREEVIKDLINWCNETV